MSASTRQGAMTIREFADAIGVSKTTVSKAFTGNGRIAPATSEAILKSAKEMGFTMNPHAQRLSSGQSKDLFCLFYPPELSAVSMRKATHIQRLLAQEGIDLPLYSSGLDGRKDQAESLTRLCRQRPRAIICSTMILADSAVAALAAYRASGGIVIYYDAPIELAADRVIFDRVDNAYQVVRHLLELGHRKIGLSLVGSFQARERFFLPRIEGFRKALAEFGVTENPDWMFDGGDNEEQGALVAARFLEMRDRPTAFYIANERVASAFINQVLRAGLRVPRDVSVASHDDQPVAKYAIVPITTVTHPSEEIAQQVVNLLLERLEDPDAPPKQVVVHGHLVVRESAAPPT